MFDDVLLLDDEPVVVCVPLADVPVPSRLEIDWVTECDPVATVPMAYSSDPDVQPVGWRRRGLGGRRGLVLRLGRG